MTEQSISEEQLDRIAASVSKQIIITVNDTLASLGIQGSMLPVLALECILSAYAKQRIYYIGMSAQSVIDGGGTREQGLEEAEPLVKLLDAALELLQSSEAENVKAALEKFAELQKANSTAS